MILEKNYLIGILTAIGGVGLLFEAFNVLAQMIQLEDFLSISFNLRFSDVGLDPVFYYINFAMTLIYGLLSIFLAIMTLLNKKYVKYLIFIIGIASFISIFIIIRDTQTYEISPSISIRLSSIRFSTTGNAIEPFLLLLAGVFAVSIKEIKLT